MNVEDFNRLREIAKELNDIRFRNNLSEIQLRAESLSLTYYETHKEWNEVKLLTRGERKYRDCKIVSMKLSKETNELEEDMEYNKYMNYCK